jgi:hypothetical protein
MTTIKVMNEFKNTINEDNVYDLKELKILLTNSFNNVAYEEKNANKTKKTRNNNGEQKPKRAPTAYNNFISFKIKEIRANDKSITAKEAMSKAAAVWKEMSEEEKKMY